MLGKQNPLKNVSYYAVFKAVNTNFEVIGLTLLGIKLKSTTSEADALTTRPSELYICLYHVMLIASIGLLNNETFKQ